MNYNSVDVFLLVHRDQSYILFVTCISSAYDWPTHFQNTHFTLAHLDFTQLSPPYLNTLHLRNS